MRVSVMEIDNFDSENDNFNREMISGTFSARRERAGRID